MGLSLASKELCELLDEIEDFDYNIAYDIAEYMDRNLPLNTIFRYKNESITEFAYRMKGSNDTLIGVIKDMLKKGDGQHLTRNFPLLVSWIEQEVSNELNNGYQFALEHVDKERIAEVWDPEVQSYSVVLHILEKFISFDIYKQQKIAGVRNVK
jgi:hypothetical protein